MYINETSSYNPKPVLSASPLSSLPIASTSYAGTGITSNLSAFRIPTQDTMSTGFEFRIDYVIPEKTSHCCQQRGAAFVNPMVSYSPSAVPYSIYHNSYQIFHFRVCSILACVSSVMMYPSPATDRQIWREEARHPPRLSKILPPFKLTTNMGGGRHKA